VNEFDLVLIAVSEAVNAGDILEGFEDGKALAELRQRVRKIKKLFHRM